MNKSFRCLFSLFLVFTLCPQPMSYSAIESPEQCEKALEPHRVRMLEHLERVEYHYVQYGWAALKYQEVTYGPLWKALRQMEDPYSPEERAEGDMLYDRYQAQADLYQTKYEEDLHQILSYMELLRKNSLVFDDQCSAWGFQDCLESWDDWLRDALRNLEEFLMRYSEEVLAMNHDVENATEETLSEHHNFAERYYEVWVRWHYYRHPQFLKMMRRLQELLENDWPGTRCCFHCSEEFARASVNSLERNLVADPDASLGVQGNVVGGTNLVKAFESFDEKES